MAVLGWRRIIEGTGFSGKVGEPLRYDEAWLIRNSSPLDSKQAIVKAVPCGWYSSHWENAACKAMEFKLSPVTREGLLWRLDVAFYPPPPQATLKSNGIPEDFWERQGGVSIVPAFRDRGGTMITNSAGEPVEGLEREREDTTWTLTKFYLNDDWRIDVSDYAGSVNQFSWANGAPKTWKCYFRSAKKREIQNLSRNKAASDASEGTPASGGTDETLVVVETVWEFRYDPGTWKAMPWDVGFHELTEGGKRRAIVDQNGKPVKQPVALENGVARSPGLPPLVINGGNGADLYVEKQFDTKFGSPFIIPPTAT